jgi:Na+/H+ antiporter NhaC
LPYPTAWNAETFTIKGITSNIDALRGVATAFVCTYILFLVTGDVSFTRLSDNFIKGLESMTFVLVVLGFSYMLKEVQGVLGFDTLIAEKLGNILNPKLLPAIIFLVVSAICWSTAATWGVYAILLPLTVTLSIKTGADFWLVQGALASASVWGNASCLFSDNRVIVARATESDLISHGITQMPYQLIVLTASTILYLIAGLIL